MNNTQGYINLVDYSVKLSESVEKIDGIFWSKPPKEMGSFRVTMMNIAAIIDNIMEIQKLRDQMRNLPTLDYEAKKDNKSARKAAEQISSIKTKLNQSYTELKDEFFKQMDLAGKQCREVWHAIKDKEQKENFYKASRDFELMVYESRTEKSKIPFNKTVTFAQFTQDMAMRDHTKKEIDHIADIRLQGIDKLQSTLSSITTILAMKPTDDLSKEARKEVAQIKKALPPKVIAVTKESLEQLRHSSHLLLDLEQISEIMKTSHYFRGKDGKLQKINKQLESLKPLLERAIQEERKRNMDISQKHDDIQDKVDYAASAAKAYRDKLDGDARLKQEQTQIGNNNHSLYTESSFLADGINNYAGSTQQESLESLKIQLRHAEDALEKITIRVDKTVPWAPGVQDQFNTESYSYEEYTDRDKAERLKSEISSLKDRIDNYARRAQQERERQEALIESRIPKYDYVVDGEHQTTDNQALAARYNAQQRLFGMSKLKRAIATVTGQKRKFNKLWTKVNITEQKEREEIASEFDRMFR